ncbi:MAG: Rid family hydrolase [Candidatus Omnitrophica bacterium]|nr:Rid family hydrolase [Candidatus Omnitrophota bacterium]
MKKFSLRISDIPVSIKASHFQRKEGPEEFHIAIYPYKLADLDTQIRWVYRAYIEILNYVGIDIKSAIFCRFFLSDIVNQMEVIKNSALYSDISKYSSTSIICQPPGPSAKIALWSYHINDKNRPLNKTKDSNSLMLRQDGIIHYWTSGLTCPEEKTIYEQTLYILEKYNDFLNTHGMSLKDNVIRTWFFIQNIDINYREFVKARREYYEKAGLSKDTHFIASTGIQGSSKDILSKVTMDTYAISGLKQTQIQFLSAPEYLSPTYVYGVTFERGTAISYRDRKHIFLSGTASIDNKGNILYQGDVIRQLDRTLINIEALLKKAGANLKDIAIFIVYVRDPSDFSIVVKKMRQKFKDTPIITVYASVCRPGWLVEIECLAITP